VERQGDAFDAFNDPNFLCSHSYRKPGQYTTFSGYEKARQWTIDFAGEHRSQTSKASWKEAPPKACEQPAKSSPT
jgi:hypothetical protein